jgi:diguanylate cyclase (GGDEF)-like protein
VTFVAAVLGVATKGVEPLALFWPANAVLIGWLLRRPGRLHPLCWAGAAIGFVAADLFYGRGLDLALVLLFGNMAEVVAGVLLLAPLGAEGRRLGHPQAVLRAGLTCVLAALAGGIVSALGFVLLGDSAVLWPAFLWNALTWWISDLAAMAAVLPVVLSLPRGKRPPGWIRMTLRQRLPALLGPAAFLFAMAGLGIATHGVGMTGFLALPLIWFAMRAGIFATTVMALLTGLWIFTALGFGFYTSLELRQAQDAMQVLLPIRFAVALISLSAVLVASIMASRRRAESRLLESEHRLALAFEGTNDGIWDLEVPSRQLSARDSGVLAGRSAVTPRRPLGDWLRRIHPEDRERASTVLEDHLAGRSPGCVVEYRWPAPEGGWIWLLARGRVVERDGAGRPLRVVGSYMDVSARKALEQKIEYMASHDALTGLANRHALNAALRGRIAAYRRRSVRTVLLVIDLDGFKAVNDGHGHLAGDTVLSVLGRRLTEALPDGAVAARTGGDEFAVIGEGLDPDQVEALALRIRAAFSMAVPIGTGTVSVGASVGWAFLPDDAVDDRGLFSVADARLYAAKQRVRPGPAAPDPPSRASA